MLHDFREKRFFNSRTTKEIPNYHSKIIISSQEGKARYLDSNKLPMYKSKGTNEE
jgi:hypothetical protein